MKINTIPLTAKELSRIFRYEARTGKLFWRGRPAYHMHAGDEAGSINNRGYRQVGVDNKLYQVHRIIWLMVYGEIRDDLEIDHINGIKDDNRIGNLRLVTHQQNQHNRNHTKAKGYFWAKREGKWVALIGIDGRQIYLGSFVEEQDAKAAYSAAKKRYHLVTL